MWTAPSAQALQGELRLPEGMCRGDPRMFHRGAGVTAFCLKGITWDSLPFFVFCFLYFGFCSEPLHGHLCLLSRLGMDDKNATKLNELIQAG